MDSDIIEVPKEVLPQLVESYLNAGHRVYVFVQAMPEKKTFGCKEKGCSKPIIAYPPDDIHTTAILEPREDAVERTYHCPEGHENKLYWVGSPRPIFTSTRR